MERMSPRFKLPAASILWKDDSQDFYFAGQLDDYRVMNKLGQGQYGIVKLGVHVKTGERVALKIINKADLTEIERLSLKREAEVMSFLNHRNIIRTVSVIENRINLCLVMEYAAGGELFDHIIRQTKLKEVEARNLFVQMLEGIGHCHSKGIIHRDIKAENIFLDEKLESIKIGDFGFSSVIGDEGEDAACGSLDYAAPEILGARSHPGPEGDVWALGVVLYFMVTGMLPFKAATDFDIFQKIRKADYRPLPSSTSPDLVAIIKMIFEPNPLNRPTVAQVMQQPWCQQAFKDPEYLKHPRLPRMLQLQIKQNFTQRLKNMSRSDAAAHGEIVSINGFVLSSSEPNTSSSAPIISNSQSSPDPMSLSSKVAAAKLARARSSQKAQHSQSIPASNPVIPEDKPLTPMKRSSTRTSSRDSGSKLKKSKSKNIESSQESKSSEHKTRNSKRRRQRHEILEADEEGVAVDLNDSPRLIASPDNETNQTPIKSLIPILMAVPPGGDKVPQPIPGEESKVCDFPEIKSLVKEIREFESESRGRRASQPPPLALGSLTVPSSRLRLSSSGSTSPRSGRKPSNPLSVSNRERRGEKRSSSRSSSRKNSPTSSPATSPRSRKEQSPTRRGSYSARSSRVRTSDFSVVKMSQDQLEMIIANKEVEVLSVEKEGEANVVVLSAPASRNRMNTVRDLLEQFEKNATRLKRSKSTENVHSNSTIVGSESSPRGRNPQPSHRKTASTPFRPNDTDSPEHPHFSPQERPEVGNLKQRKIRSNSYNHQMFRDMLHKKRGEIADSPSSRRSDGLRRKFPSESETPGSQSSETVIQ